VLARAHPKRLACSQSVKKRLQQSVFSSGGDVRARGALRGRRARRSIRSYAKEPPFDADDNLGEDTKRFIDRHVTLGDKRPAAPSVRRDTEFHQARRKTGA
jgi:hypothetical protein